MLRRSMITGDFINCLQLVEVERAELLPFGDDDQRVGLVGAGVGIVA